LIFYAKKKKLEKIKSEKILLFYYDRIRTFHSFQGRSRCDKNNAKILQFEKKY
jgi:hypothetical protein